jgi:hypothetical protein
VYEHWLLYGPSPSKEEGAKGLGSKVAALSAEAIKLAQKIQAQSPHRRYLKSNEKPECAFPNQPKIEISGQFSFPIGVGTPHRHVPHF